jgi:AsmA protein
LEASGEPRTPVLANLHANGQITADKFQIQKVQATHITANVSLENGKLQISDLTADLLGGQVQGEWKLDFTARPGVCKGSGSMTGISLSALSGAASDGWVEGVGQAKYDIESTCTADFWRLAQGVVRVDVRNGTLPRLFIAENQQPVQIIHLSGQGQLQGGKIEIKDAKLLSRDGAYQVSGTASLSRQLDLKLTPAPNSPSAGYAISGTLSAPRVAPLTGAIQARLKSLPTK